ncbi:MULTISPECIES: NfeD family protein [Actinopolyspora]|uniref:Membrane protein implicated in regulation of membrane protease activity n=1 Tax=Actinopolyspora saharensis TaxID=995062 RepID=A0A1H0ZLJ7_9ACTN|nr:MULTISPECIES: NfeD family protein [Actinopolyspora]NHD15711.1 NfeD family protein [Actinopolyspora sp. BKK2]NHE75075.1 NfeD family protein [Actinopolyspora sp. BKK1]SDQ28199.1 Membrane protein implicated in regulation of membrane protease activity [Actinopolyspora saharensis]
MAALVWLVAGVLLVAAEVTSGELVLLMLGLAAMGTAGAAALGAPLWLDAVIFAGLSTGLVLLARPVVKRRLMRETSEGGEPRTNVEALVGKRARVESPVDAHDGRVRINGDVWSARSLDETQVLDVGRTVLVVEISGAVAVVWPEP